jgi:hypothetical protein
MASAAYTKILEEAKLLSAEELNRLIEALAERAELEDRAPGPPPRWEDLIGTAPYPLCGEDAQAWVTRTRKESDEARRIR